jgi:hypothetical protein
LSSQPASFAWLIFSVAMDGGQDSLAGAGGNVIWPVKGSGYRGDAHIQFAGEL